MRPSILIPARNDAANTGPPIDAVRARLAREGVDYEVVVVDDGSEDDTAAEVLARRAMDPCVILVRNEGLHGFGRAVRCGLDVYTGDAVVIMMADGSDDPDDVIAYYRVLRDEAECAFGSRFVPGGGVVDYPRLKLAVNRLANTFIQLLFGTGYNDTTNAFKGYRREVILGCQPLISPHFNLTVEIPLKAIVRGYSFKVLPITWRNRKHGVSSLKLEEQGSRYLYIVLNVWLERLLTRGDYSRPRPHAALPADPGTRAGTGAR